MKEINLAYVNTTLLMDCMMRSAVSFEQLTWWFWPQLATTVISQIIVKSKTWIRTNLVSQFSEVERPVFHIVTVAYLVFALLEPTSLLVQKNPEPEYALFIWSDSDMFILNVLIHSAVDYLNKTYTDSLKG